MIVVQDQIYRHFNGTSYRVVTTATRADDGVEGEQLIVYTRADGTDGRIWARSLQDFTSTLPDGRARFTLDDPEQS